MRKCALLTALGFSLANDEKVAAQPEGCDLAFDFSPTTTAYRLY